MSITPAQATPLHTDIDTIARISRNSTIAKACARLKVAVTKLTEVAPPPPPPPPPPPALPPVWTQDGGPRDVPPTFGPRESTNGTPVMGPNVFEGWNWIGLEAWLNTNVPPSYTGPGYVDWEGVWQTKMLAGDSAALNAGIEVMKFLNTKRPNVQWGFYQSGRIYAPSVENPYDQVLLAKTIRDELKRMAPMLAHCKGMYIAVYDGIPNELPQVNDTIRKAQDDGYRLSLDIAAETGLPTYGILWHRHFNSDLAKRGPDGKLLNPFAMTLISSAEYYRNAQAVFSAKVAGAIMWGGWRVEQYFLKSGSVSKEVAAKDYNLGEKEWLLMQQIVKGEYPDGYAPEKVNPVMDHYVKLLQDAAAGKPWYPLTPQPPRYTGAMK